MRIAILGKANAGKSSLVGTLNPKKTMLINFDKKPYKGKLAHINVGNYDGWDNLKNEIVGKAVKFKEKFGETPTNYVFDTMTSLSNLMLSYGKKTFRDKKVFSAYDVLDSEMDSFIAFLAWLETINKNVIINMHLVEDEGTLNLMSQSNLKKAGGYLSIVDYSVMVQQTVEGPEVIMSGTTMQEKSFVRYPVNFNCKEPRTKMNDNQDVLQQYIDDIIEFEQDSFGEEL